MEKNAEKCCITECTKPLDKDFWDSKYEKGETGWDLGMVSPALRAYIDQLSDKHISILIPGCGNSYEAAYLLQQGFTDITLIDIAALPVKRLNEQFKDHPHVKVLMGDFFEHEGRYNLILEQTFFCALNPSLRKDYVSKMKSLLVPGGKLVGVLFDKEFDFEGPPFGGCKCEYESLFRADFFFKTFEPCYNSAVPRQGSELFINFVRK